MRITSIRITNFRGYKDSGVIDLGPLNVFIGSNNAGKSSLLRAVHTIQAGNGVGGLDIRVNETTALIELGLVAMRAPFFDAFGHPGGNGALRVTLATNSQRTAWSKSLSTHTPSERTGINELPAVEPDHFIVPFYSKRKAASFSEDTRDATAKSVQSDLSNLVAKLGRLSNEGYPGHLDYKEACRRILGEAIFTIPGLNGQHVGSWVDQNNAITLSYMGDGVPHILGLLAELAVANDKLFLIEEPENDLHPQALKALLALIVKKSENNQFILTTHSNIVVTYLASQTHSRLFKVTGTREGRYPVTNVAEVEQTPEARFEVLKELGYGLSDYELRDGWLILEESSAQRIIGNYLIPMFAPGLKRLCVVSANGAARVEPVFDDFFRLILFTHLQASYKDSVWVRVDADAAGQQVVSKLTQRFPDWEAGRFSTLSQSEFESYYPKHFEGKVRDVLAISDKNAKREAKKQLLLELVDWLNDNDDRAREALAVSAADVIQDLREIERVFARQRVMHARGSSLESQRTN